MSLQKSDNERRAIATSHESTLEEGELSEGEFDDLYEPKESVYTAMPAPPSTHPPSLVENQDGSAGDADGSSIYDGATPQNEVITNSTSTSLPTAEPEYFPDEDWEPSYDREQSYSPHLSPREIQRKVSVSKPTLRAQPTQAQPFPGLGMASVPQPPAGAPASNGVADPRAASGAPSKDHATLPVRSVAEAKKKAQEAILGLMPMKVRYQDYIDEGVDEKVIKSLFIDLGLEASIPKPTVAHKNADGQQPQTTPSIPNHPKPVPGSQDTHDRPSSTPKADKISTAESAVNTSNAGDAKTTKKSAAEERKDKIARKLAAKAQKTVTAVQPSAPKPPPSQPAQTSQPPQSNGAQANGNKPTSMTASPAKTKTRAENNAILYQKLAALKKLQEEKAMAEKKLAAEKSMKPDTPSALPANKSPASILSSTNPVVSSTNSAAIAIAAPELSRRSVSTEKSLPRESGIPGLSLSTQLTQPAHRNLKRPVASDFDGYPTPGGTLKRTRTQETQDTLIIDVSDDEDVEMDIGSPTDEPNSANETTNSGLRQTPLGAFPPLSDSHNWKQRTSPNSSAVPAPSLNGAKLDLLTKRIEEQKRMIAEAEAKKLALAKKASAPRTPSAPPAAVETVAVPVVSEAYRAQEEAKKANAERRDRIVSFELPTIEALLKEKQERLKKTVAEAAELELEIQTRLEERRRLASALEELKGSLELPHAETDTQAQPILSTEPNPALESTHVGSPQSPHVVRSSEEQDVDVSMTEGEIIEQDQGVVSNGVQPRSDSAQPTSPGSNQHFAGTAQDHAVAGKDMRAEASNPDLASENVSAAAFDDNEADHNTMADLSEVEVEEQDQDQAKMDISEPSTPGDPSPNGDDSYEPHTALAPPTRNISPSGIEDVPAKPFSPQEQSSTMDVELRAQEVVNETGPSAADQALTSSAPENPSGEVQNSSTHEHLLLTSTQDHSEQAPQLEDLLSYHSPLEYFRAYRFHPKYFDAVAGGLKSMTYSAKIDPMRPICPNVSDGEQCPNGNACEFQHFETMVLPDAEIITQLGSADMFTGETRNKFIEGLKRVLNELKANKVKDFDRITKAIVKHRQEFLEDKSKVLPLDTGNS